VQFQQRELTTVSAQRKSHTVVLRHNVTISRVRQHNTRLTHYVKTASPPLKKIAKT